MPQTFARRPSQPAQRTAAGTPAAAPTLDPGSNAALQESLRSRRPGAGALGPDGGRFGVADRLGGRQIPGLGLGGPGPAAGAGGLLGAEGLLGPEGLLGADGLLSGRMGLEGALDGVTPGPGGGLLGRDGLGGSSVLGLMAQMSSDPRGGPTAAAPGADPWLAAGGSSGKTPDGDLVAKDDFGGPAAGGSSSTWSGRSTHTDTTDSNGRQRVTSHEVYDDGEQIVEVSTVHEGGTTTQTVTATDKDTGETTTETSTDGPEEGAPPTAEPPTTPTAARRRTPPRPRPTRRRRCPTRSPPAPATAP